MNYLAFTTEEWDSRHKVTVSGQRANYVREFHDISPQDIVWCVVLGVGRGVATCLSSSAERYEFSISELQPEPPPLPITLYQGLCRPQTIKKVLQLGAMLRLKRIIFFASERGEKSYQQSKLLRGENQLYELIKGCEQVGNPYPPTVEVSTGRFQSLFEEISSSAEINDPLRENLRLVASPTGAQSLADFVRSGQPFPHSLDLLIGPEAGFLEEEVLYYTKRGFQPITLGRDHLRVESAFHFLMAQLALWRALGAGSGVVNL